MCYTNIFSVVISMTSLTYKVFLQNVYKGKNALSDSEVDDEYINQTDYTCGTELYTAFNIFQYRLSGVFAWDMTEYYIWSYENECSYIDQNVDIKCVHILFYDDELLDSFKISDTFEYNNLKMTCETNKSLSFIQTYIDKKSLLRRELYHGSLYGTVLFSDSKYNEPFYNWHYCSCIHFCND